MLFLWYPGVSAGQPLPADAGVQIGKKTLLVRTKKRKAPTEKAKAHVRRKFEKEKEKEVDGSANANQGEGSSSVSLFCLWSPVSLMPEY